MDGLSGAVAWGAVGEVAGEAVAGTAVDGGVTVAVGEVERVK